LLFLIFCLTQSS